MLLCALTISARPYQHSVGVNVGGINGVSYKGYVRSLEHMIVIADLGVKVSATKGLTESIIQHTSGQGQSSTDYQTASDNGHYVYYSFEANPNLGYQGDIADLDVASFHWYAGGGISAGFSQISNNWDNIAEQRKYESPYWFKFGINAIAGAEMCLKNAPVNFGLDFRPGVAINMDSNTLNYMGVKRYTFISATHFDWALAASIRYRF